MAGVYLLTVLVGIAGFWVKAIVKCAMMQDAWGNVGRGITR
jgi:hypothetical protein